MPLQFDLIPAPVKGRMFEWRGPKWRIRVCVYANGRSPNRKSVEAQTRNQAVKAAIAKAHTQSLQIESIGALPFWRGVIFRKSDFHFCGSGSSHRIAEHRHFCRQSIQHTAVWLRGALAQ
jgi:hypothetical protein